MIICICRRVSDFAITQVAKSGASFDELQLDLGVAMQCRACEGCARELYAQYQSAATAFCRSAGVPMIMPQPSQRLPQLHA
jgi:bacterioferritin-associated ferredoxin